MFYSILAVTPLNEDWFSTYLPVANKLVNKYGGKYLARTVNHEQLEGPEDNATIRIILEWPSREAAVDFMNDPEYKPCLELRTNGSKSFHYLVEGKDDLA
ncbi:DUF1330 domain-containing protein [Cetobacterium sp.]|uniref:DUF1330 domain-containing protein n=1 Tax=Cetobacterium sp. TaxID=2071632 RepID=UPI003F2C41B5